jgi:hypothetical protein
VRSGGEVRSGVEVSSAGGQAETSFWKASSTVPKCGNLFSLSFFFLVDWGLNSGLPTGKQVLYLLSHPCSPFCFGSFGDGVS